AVSRQQTNRKEQLFGSNTNSNSIISIKISNAEVRQDLGRNWYYDTNVITEINMTTIQYAEMISSPNTSGVPCTIKRTEKLGLIKYKPIDTEA
ncbi:hypothetical protein ACKI16_46630, partial [Streptomyces scabiei]|uniref:hypothetical protein n=1 Tax=Streptomyces scabiei TaxID=1930 RepID=UPI0038F6D220